MQDDKTGGVPIRTVKSFLSKIPSVVTGRYRLFNFTFFSGCVLQPKMKNGHESVSFYKLESDLITNEISLE